MSHYKDWRPHTLNVESLATDAQLTRIEAKLDLLLERLELLAGLSDHKSNDVLYVVPPKR